MSGRQDIVSCPKCGFEEAVYDWESKTKEAWMLCQRCGYYVDDYIDREESTFPDKLIWRHQDSGGKGCLCYGEKGKSASVGPATEGNIDAMKKHLDKLGVAKYSFQKNGEWFIRDLIHEETIPFSHEKMTECSR